MTDEFMRQHRDAKATIFAPAEGERIVSARPDQLPLPTDLPADLEERLYAALLWWHREGWRKAHDEDPRWPGIWATQRWAAEEEHRLAAKAMTAWMRGEGE